MPVNYTKMIQNSQNMPDGYEGKFMMNEWNSNTLHGISTGGNGYYWVHLRSDGCKCPPFIPQYLFADL
jgi:hypothetical protein